MSDPYIGEIRMFGGSFAPVGWAFCNGAQVPISQNDTLFTLLGTTYGGDGQEVFNLPDLQGALPMHNGQGPGITQNYGIGEAAGVEEVTLTVQQIPVHNHAVIGTSALGGDPNPAGNFLASSPNVNAYGVYNATSPFASTAIAPIGGSQPHTNIMPYLCISFILSLYGIFPSQS